MPRRVLLLHSSSGHYGADRQLALIARGLDPGRFTPIVVLARPGPLANDLRESGIDVAVWPLAVLRRELMSPRGVARLARACARDGVQLRRLARRENVALVHSNTSVILGGAVAARASGIPHVWHVREIYAAFERLWPAHRRLLGTATQLACVSEATAAQFAGSRARTRVIPDGIALTRDATDSGELRAGARRALGLEEGTFACVVLGRLSAWKGQEVLLRALGTPELARVGAVGLVAGDPWPGQAHHRRHLERLVGELGLGARARLLGFCTEPELLYAASDVVVVPSTSPDPLPNAALEAAAAGCCVVASAHGGLPEIVRDRQTGRLVEPGDADALARVLAELAADPEQRARLGASAAGDVRERFDPARCLEALQTVYELALSR